MKFSYRPVIGLLFAVMLYSWSLQNSKKENFVAYNAFEPVNPEMIPPQGFDSFYEKFGTLLQTVNGTSYAVAYHQEDLINTLKDIINSVGIGKFRILSVGDMMPFTLTNVLIQDEKNLAYVKFSRVDFIVSSVKPFVIQKVILLPDETFNASQESFPAALMDKKNLFALDNPLHLFYPYKTSDNDMVLTAQQETDFNAVVAEHAALLAEMDSAVAATGTTGETKTYTTPYAPISVSSGWC